MFAKDRCADCNQTDFIEIGKQKDASIQGINDSTIYTFYQCRKCGSIWIEIKERGVSGHGHLFHNITKKYF